MLLSVLMLCIGAAAGGGIALLVCRRSGLSGSPSSRCCHQWDTIAVPLVDRTPPLGALTVAARLSIAAHGHVVLLAVAPVPRTMSIDTATPPGLETALERLEEAECMVRDLGAQVHGEVVRVREIGDVVGRACAEAGAQVVVLEPDPTSRSTAELLRALCGGKGTGRFDIVIARTASS